MGLKAEVNPVKSLMRSSERQVTNKATVKNEYPTFDIKSI